MCVDRREVNKIPHEKKLKDGKTGRKKITEIKQKPIEYCPP